MGRGVIMLQVEEVNEPARKLYESVGYSLVHKDEAATALRVQPGAGAGAGLLRNEVSTLLLLGEGAAVNFVYFVSYSTSTRQSLNCTHAGRSLYPSSTPLFTRGPSRTPPPHCRCCPSSLCARHAREAPIVSVALKRRQRV